MRYYKVLSVRGGDLWSWNYSSRWAVKYNKEDYTYGPNGTKLFVFESLSTAINFLGASRDKVIYEVEVINPEPIGNCLNLNMLSTLIYEFWRGEVDSLFVNKAPSHSFACSAVKLVKEVDTWKKTY